ncbi:MAG: hypothetical protein Ct9H300mP29_3880 [Candidatus Neomarinimicrobiota bacterium]|nr:MAG: hypothetical protein Ct9H300mP29_3880 [Candidatus Neomarinimicrobiota bacterium]
MLEFKGNCIEAESGVMLGKIVKESIKRTSPAQKALSVCQEPWVEHNDECRSIRGKYQII